MNNQISINEILININNGYAKEMLIVINNLLKDYSKDVSLLEIKIIALSKLENFDEALKISDEILESDSENEKALVVKASILSMSIFNRLDEALSCINKAIKNNQNDNIILNQKGIILFELEKYQEALNIFNNILKNDSKNIEILNYKGRCLLVLNKLREALGVFNDILHIDSNNIYAQKNKELVLSKMPI